MKYKYEVDIYTDGACKGNPGPGGWAAVLLVKDPPAKKVIQGGQLQTTNNQMEIKAIIEGIKALKMPSKVNIYSDSNYVVQGATECLEFHNFITSFRFISFCFLEFSCCFFLAFKPSNDLSSCLEYVP